MALKIPTYKIPSYSGFGGLTKSKKRTLGARDRQILYHRANKRCEGCGKKIDYTEMHVGHKKAYSKGGATTLANTVALCYGCNKLQGTDNFDSYKKKRTGTYGKRQKKTVKKTKKKKRRSSGNYLGIISPSLPKMSLYG